MAELVCGTSDREAWLAARREGITATDWFCPICGGRLSYGVYCKACGIEPGFEWRPATDRDREIAKVSSLLRSLPVPDYPGYIDD